MDIEGRIRKCCPKCGTTKIRKIKMCALEEKGTYRCDKCKAQFKAPVLKKIQEHGSGRMPVLKKIMDEKNRVKLTAGSK